MIEFNENKKYRIIDGNGKKRICHFHYNNGFPEFYIIRKGKMFCYLTHKYFQKIEEIN